MGLGVGGGGGDAGSLLVGIVGLQLFLQSQDLLIPLIQAASQCNHDVALFQQQLLVSINLHNTISRAVSTKAIDYHKWDEKHGFCKDFVSWVLAFVSVRSR